MRFDQSCIQIYIIAVHVTSKYCPWIDSLDQHRYACFSILVWLMYAYNLKMLGRRIQELGMRALYLTYIYTLLTS